MIWLKLAPDRNYLEWLNDLELESLISFQKRTHGSGVGGEMSPSFTFLTKPSVLVVLVHIPR